MDKQVLAGVRKVLQDARCKFDFSTVLESAKKLSLKEYSTYKSDHAGVKDLLLPANGDFNYEN